MSKPEKRVTFKGLLPALQTNQHTPLTPFSNASSMIRHDTPAALRNELTRPIAFPPKPIDGLTQVAEVGQMYSESFDLLVAFLSKHTPRYWNGLKVAWANTAAAAPAPAGDVALRRAAYACYSKPSPEKDEVLNNLREHFFNYTPHDVQELAVTLLHNASTVAEHDGLGGIVDQKFVNIQTNVLEVQRETAALAIVLIALVLSYLHDAKTLKHLAPQLQPPKLTAVDQAARIEAAKARELHDVAAAFLRELDQAFPPTNERWKKTLTKIKLASAQRKQ
jgi:hypothetical protein